MQTIRLQVSDRIYEKFLDSLNQIEGEDIRIIKEDQYFQNLVAEAHEDYAKMKSGETERIDFEDFERSILEIL